jgi:class 3 adenylate cyclase
MVTGVWPFTGDTPISIMIKRLREPPPSPRVHVPELDAAWEAAILRCLERRPEDRFASAGDVADALLGASTHPAASSRAVDSNAETVARSVRRSGRYAERRQLTVLVAGCQAFESDAYLALDAEDQARMLQAFQGACEESIRQFGGTVVQRTDTGLLACFGFPVAYEDAAGRAARSGLAIVDALKAPQEPWVVVHTGTGVVEATSDRVSLVGEARNVAVRLEDVAVAGQVICTDASHRLFQGQLQCAALGQQKVKNITQPLDLFRVEHVVLGGSPVDAAAPAELSPLTGRDQEIALLMDRWEQAREGMGQVVLLLGEPGVGKSRLVHTMKERVLGQMVEGDVDAPVIEWRCSPHFQNTRLYPAIDFYERALAFDGEEPRQARFERLLQRLEQYGLARPDTVPLWASLLSLPTPEHFPRLSLSPARQREETFQADARVAADAHRPQTRASSSSRICTGQTRRRWSSLGSFSPRASTTPSSRCSRSAPTSSRPGRRCAPDQSGAEPADAPTGR